MPCQLLIFGMMRAAPSLVLSGMFRDLLLSLSWEAAPLRPALRTAAGATVESEIQSLSRSSSDWSDQIACPTSPKDVAPSVLLTSRIELHCDEERFATTNDYPTATVVITMLRPTRGAPLQFRASLFPSPASDAWRWLVHIPIRDAEMSHTRGVLTSERKACYLAGDRFSERIDELTIELHMRLRMKTLPEYAPRLRESCVSRKFLLLGRIIDNLDDDLAACKGTGTDIEYYKEHQYADQWTTWELYNIEYTGWRTDYRVFRLVARQPYFDKRHIVVPAGLTGPSRTWRPAMDDARNAVERLRDSRILWGVIASLPELIRQAISSDVAVELDAAAALCKDVFDRLNTDLRPLDDCRANCGLTATLFTIAYHNLMLELHGELTDNSFFELA